MTQSRIRLPARRVVATPEEAAGAMARLAEIRSTVAECQTALDDDKREVQARYDACVAPLAAEERTILDELQVWATANRAALTNNGARKAAVIGPGRISWRRRPPRIEIEKSVEETLVATLRTLGLGRFLRQRETVDKQAMLKEPDVARTVAGVTVVGGEEELIIETRATS